MAIWCAFVGFTLSLLAWAFASPVGSAPDEDFHIANIYCIHDSSTCRSDDWDWPTEPPWWPADPADRQGPDYASAYLVYPDLWWNVSPREWPCYVSNGTPGYGPDASVPAACLDAQDPRDNTPGTLDLLSHYPSAYYNVMSVLTRSTIRESVATWRVVNVGLAVGVLSLAWLLTAPRFRRAAAVSMIVASGPVGFFLIASVNPSSWLLVGAAAFLGPALTQLRAPFVWDRVTWARLAFLVLCLFLMMAGRSEGLVHAVVIVIVAMLLGLRVSRRAVLPLAMLGAAALVLVGLATPSLLGEEKISIFSGMALLGAADGKLWDALLAVPGYFFGGKSILLGWHEVIPPDTAIIAAQIAFWGAIMLGIAAMFRRKAAALALVAGVLLIPPALMAAGGWLAPPTRYFMPLLYMAGFAALYPRWTGRQTRWSAAQWWVLGAASVVANALSLLYLIVRYVSGISPGTTNPWVFANTATPGWWWGAWLGPFATWLLGSLAFGVGLAGLYWVLAAGRQGHGHKQREQVGQHEGHAVVHVVEQEEDGQQR